MNSNKKNSQILQKSFSTGMWIFRQFDKVIFRKIETQGHEEYSEMLSFKMKGRSARAISRGENPALIAVQYSMETQPIHVSVLSKTIQYRFLFCPKLQWKPGHRCSTLVE